MPGNLFTNYFLTEGIKATAEWRTSISDSTAFAAFRDGDSSTLRCAERLRRPQRGRHRAGADSPGTGTLGMGRLPSPAGDNPQRGHTRLSSLHRCRIQGARRREEPTLRNDSGMPSWWRRASVSVSPSMPATGTTDANPGRPTARFCGTSRRLTSSRRAVSGGDS